MDTSNHTMNTLFAQLGLSSDSGSIQQFIQSHTPIPAHIGLSEADFWTPSQANFLREALSDDSDWAEIVDELNAQLRH
ncbi:MAG: DUF2789 domain-containing protein [Pseudomonadales bacterium]|nr:DUF2789 domain-containing protein [Pseudomonadales bacterium]